MVATAVPVETMRNAESEKPNADASATTVLTVLTRFRLFGMVATPLHRDLPANFDYFSLTEPWRSAGANRRGEFQKLLDEPRSGGVRHTELDCPTLPAVDVTKRIFPDVNRSLWNPPGHDHGTLLSQFTMR